MAKIKAFFTTILLIFSYLLGIGGQTVAGGYTVARQEKLNSVVSMHAAQGLCCDGEHFYGSGSITAVNFTGLSKFDLQMNCQKKRANAVPKEFSEAYGSNHIGGIDCANGRIYAPVEGKGQNNFILLYDCETLEYTGTYYDMTCDNLTDGIPWLAIDRENGWLYTSPFNHVTGLLRYDLDTMEFLGIVPLQEEVNRIQGGSVYDGILYLSYDVSDSTEDQILRIDPATGAVGVEFVRTFTNYDNEAEDVCVYPLADGTLFHTVDYDKLLNANVTHYRPAA